MYDEKYDKLLYPPNTFEIITKTGAKPGKTLCVIAGGSACDGDN